MTDQEDGIALTPDDSTLAVTITEATRALIEQVAVWAREGQTSTDNCKTAARRELGGDSDAN